MKEILPDGSVKISLVEPIIYGSNKYEHLILKKPKAKHLKNIKMKDMDMSTILGLASTLSAEAPSVIDELGMEDLGEVMGVVTDFLEGLAKTGKTL